MVALLDWKRFFSLVAISAETPKLTEMPISAETETEISVGHYKYC